MGRNGLLQTVPEGFHPGSEVANSSILGYDQHKVYEGRGRSKQPVSESNWPMTIWRCVVI